MYLFNDPTQFLYTFSKINGLVPFYFDFNKGKAFPSTPSVIYSIFFTLVLSSFLTYYIYILSVLIVDHDKELVIVIVLIADVMTAILKTILMFVFQLVRRQKIIQSINSFVRICEILFEHEYNHKSMANDIIRCLSIL